MSEDEKKQILFDTIADELLILMREQKKNLVTILAHTTKIADLCQRLILLEEPRVLEMRKGKGVDR